MIEGFVNAFREPIICFPVRGPKGRALEFDVVVDTGFDSSPTLPIAAITELELPFRRRGRAVLPDGSETYFDVYEGIVLWEGVERRINVDEAETEPLAGMTLMYGSELRIQVADGGYVQIEPMA